MSEIPSLALRIRDLSQSVDWWNVAMIWGLALAAIAAVFVVVATRTVVTRTGQLATAQDSLSEAKDKQLGLDLRGKDIKIVEAQRGAAEAEQHAKETGAKAEGFRLDIVRETERAARLESEAAAAKLTN